MMAQDKYSSPIDAMAEVSMLSIMMLGLSGMGGFGRSRLDYRRAAEGQIYSHPIGPPTLEIVEQRKVDDLHIRGRKYRKEHSAVLAQTASHPRNPNDTRQMRRQQDRREAKMLAAYKSRITPKAERAPPESLE